MANPKKRAEQALEGLLENLSKANQDNLTKLLLERKRKPDPRITEGAPGTISSTMRQRELSRRPRSKARGPAFRNPRREPNGEVRQISGDDIVEIFGLHIIVKDVPLCNYKLKASIVFLIILALKKGIGESRSIANDIYGDTISPKEKRVISSKLYHMHAKLGPLGVMAKKKVNGRENHYALTPEWIKKPTQEIHQMFSPSSKPWNP